MGAKAGSDMANWLSLAAGASLLALPTATLSENAKAVEVEKADQQYNRALERSDVAALRALMADEYVFTDPAGRVSSKKDVIDGFANGRIRIESQTTHDVRIGVYVDAAVETGLVTSVAVRDGRNTGGTFRFMRVWVKRGGRWRTVAFQETGLRGPRDGRPTATDETAGW